MQSLWKERAKLQKDILDLFLSVVAPIYGLTKNLVHNINDDPRLLQPDQDMFTLTQINAEPNTSGFHWQYKGLGLRRPRAVWLATIHALPVAYSKFHCIVVRPSECLQLPFHRLLPINEYKIWSHFNCQSIELRKPKIQVNYYKRYYTNHHFTLCCKEHAKISNVGVSPPKFKLMGNIVNKWFRWLAMI